MADASEVGAEEENEGHSTGAIMPAVIRAPTTASLAGEKAGRGVAALPTGGRQAGDQPDTTQGAPSFALDTQNKTFGKTRNI